jgi:hypothetical protein
MNRFFLLLSLVLASVVGVSAPAHAAPSTGIQKLCMPGDIIVAYSTACPAGTKVSAKICPDGVRVAYTSSCPLATDPVPTPTTPTPTTPLGVTLKLCSDGKTYPYRSACPSGTTVTGKICPNGIRVAYTVACPTVVKPILFGSKVQAITACSSINNNGKTLGIGKEYTVIATWGYATLTDMGKLSNGLPTGYAVVRQLSETNVLDGWNAVWIPFACIRGI